MKYRVYLKIDEQIIETYGYYIEETSARKTAIKLSRKFTGPKAKAEVWGTSEDQLIPDEKFLYYYRMGRGPRKKD